MYKIEKIDFAKIREEEPRSRVLELIKGSAGKKFESRFSLFNSAINPVIHRLSRLILKNKKLLFDDRITEILTKNSEIANYMALLKVFEIIFETRENFWLVWSEKGELAGFFYLYGFNSQMVPRRIFNTSGGIKHIEYTKTVTTACFTGCLERKFWGEESKKIFKHVLDLIFKNTEIKKIKCEIFASNPYVKGILKRFHFRKEGEFLHETSLRGKAETLEVWSIMDIEHEKNE